MENFFLNDSSSSCYEKVHIEGGSEQKNELENRKQTAELLVHKVYSFYTQETLSCKLKVTLYKLETFALFIFSQGAIFCQKKLYISKIYAN